MIWAIVSSLPCFCWQYIASPSLAANNNNNNQCDVSTEHLVIPRVESSLGRTMLAFYWIPFALQCQICLLFQVSLDFLQLHSIPLWWKGLLYLDVHSKWSCKFSYNCSTSTTSAYKLGLLCYWTVCLGNEQNSFCLLHVSWYVSFISSSAVEGHTSLQKKKKKESTISHM